MNFSQLFSLGYYWYDPGYQSQLFTPVVLTFSATLVGLGIIWAVYRNYFLKNKSLKKTTRSYAKKLIWFGLVAFLLYGMRAEHIQYLNRRILWVFYLVVFALVLFFTIKNFRINANVQVKSAIKKQTVKNKYLPVQKNKKKKKRKN